MIWYTCYGSNLELKRFLYYIKGGKLTENNREYDGCKNKDFTGVHKKMIINYTLYFSKKSGSWRGGVAFIDTIPTKIKTFARMYLVTDEQFIDILKQENSKPLSTKVSFDINKAKSKVVYNPPGLSGWYDKVIYLGENEGHSIFTFTTGNKTDYMAPSEDYLKVIARGLRDTHNLTLQEIVNYLIDKPGISGNYNKQELIDILFVVR